MKTELKKDLSYNKTLLILSALCILSGILSVALGELAVPFVAGFCAAIFVFESGRKRVYSFVVPVALIFVGAIGLIFIGSTFLLWGILCILAAFIIYYAYTRSKSKFDFSLILTGVTSVFTVLSVLIIGMICAKSFSLEASIAFYGDLYDALRDEAAKAIVDFYSELYKDTSAAITLTEAGEIIDSALGAVIAVIAVVSFILCGLCFKVFTAVISKCADNKEELSDWRFEPPSFYGHFYYILIFAYFFAAYSEGIISTVIVNLYIIFMWMFAYVGYNVVLEKFAGRKRPITVFIVITLAILLLSSFVLQILAILGAVYVTRQNVQTPKNP